MTAPLIRTVTVPCSAERAFAVFTERIGDWWPLATHTKTDGLGERLEFVDGRLVETAADGSSYVAANVTDWQPPDRLALEWLPGPDGGTSVTVEFVPETDRSTRVVLTHEGWERLGERAELARSSYGGEHAWGWVLGLFAATARLGGEHAYPVGPMRAAYEAVAVAAAGGDFGPAPAGEWDARQVAGHVITNAGLMCAVLDDVMTGRPARLHGPDDHTPAAVDRCAGQDFAAIAALIRSAGAELIARTAALGPAQLGTTVAAYIEHHGAVVVDGPMSLADLLGAQVGIHLPAHAGQLSDLVAAASTSS